MPAVGPRVDLDGSPVHVHDPVLRNPHLGVDRPLESPVEGERRTGDLDHQERLARVVAQARILAHDGEIRLGLRPVIVGKRQLWSDAVAAGELEHQLLVEELDRRGVRPALRAHGDQHAAQELDRFIDEPAEIDKAIVLAARQQPDRLRFDEGGIEGSSHHGVKHSISRAALSQCCAIRTARDRIIGCPNCPMLGQVSEAPVASRSGSQREARNRSRTAALISSQHSGGSASSRGSQITDRYLRPRTPDDGRARPRLRGEVDGHGR